MNIRSVDYKNTEKLITGGVLTDKKELWLY